GVDGGRRRRGVGRTEPGSERIRARAPVFRIGANVGSDRPGELGSLGRPLRPAMRQEFRPGDLAAPDEEWRLTGRYGSHFAITSTLSEKPTPYTGRSATPNVSPRTLSAETTATDRHTSVPCARKAPATSADMTRSMHA